MKQVMGRLTGRVQRIKTELEEVRGGPGGGAVVVQAMVLHAGPCAHQLPCASMSPSAREDAPRAAAAPPPQILNDDADMQVRG